MLTRDDLNALLPTLEEFHARFGRFFPRSESRGAAVRVTLLAVGSRGDVQPFIALGAGLRAHGHAVRLATDPEFHPLAEEAGLERLPLSLRAAGVRGVLEAPKDQCVY